METEIISIKDYLGVYGKCKDCGGSVSHYLCNNLTSVRIGAGMSDYWSACDNVKCINHYGESIDQQDASFEKCINSKHSDKIKYVILDTYNNEFTSPITNMTHIDIIGAYQNHIKNRSLHLYRWEKDILYHLLKIDEVD